MQSKAVDLPAFNLLATTYRGRENDASSELFAHLTSMGDRAPEILRTPVSGLLAVKTSIDAFHVISELAKIVESEPWSIRFILRIIPVEKIVESDVEHIRDTVQTMAERIQMGESFRITVEKRRTGISQTDLVNATAGVVDRKVDLEKPDWVVLIEVIQDVTGISIARPDQILSVMKKKRGD